MGAVQVKLEQMDSLLQEKRYWLKVLGLWAVAKEAGYAPEEIKSFTFRTEFLTKEEKHKGGARANRKAKYNGSTHHNAVRLVSGDVVPIPLTERPIPPKSDN